MLLLDTTEQALAEVAKLRGTEIRFRQFDALHQRLPLTARSSCPWGTTSWPGLKAPVASQLATSAAMVAAGNPEVASSDGSQLMPMIGTATREHATPCWHPNEAFSAEVNTSNCDVPFPSSPVTPKVSLLGKFDPPTLCDSGG